jgi:hypothetical protein
MKLKAQAVRFGPPADRTGKIVAEGSIKAQTNVRVVLGADASRTVGVATIHEDGTADIVLKDGFKFSPETHDFTIGYKALESHKEGDVNVIDAIDLIALGIVRKGDKA